MGEVVAAADDEGTFTLRDARRVHPPIEAEHIAWARSSTSSESFLDVIARY